MNEESNTSKSRDTESIHYPDLESYDGGQVYIPTPYEQWAKNENLGAYDHGHTDFKNGNNEGKKSHKEKENHPTNGNHGKKENYEKGFLDRIIDFFNFCDAKGHEELGFKD